MNLSVDAAGFVPRGFFLRVLLPWRITDRAAR